MAYSSGNTVLAADFNTFRTSIDDIFGDTNAGSVAAAALVFGYGEAMLQAAVSAGDSITAASWNNLYMMIHRCAAHQGVSITLGGGVASDKFTAGAVISADTQLSTAITAITGGKLSFDAANMTTAAKNDKSGTAGWSASTTHSFTQTFASYDAARHFYNSGGAMIFSASRAGGTGSTQNSDWTALLTAVGTVTWGHSISGTSGTAGGGVFSDVIANPNLTRDVWTHAGSGQYTANTYKIQVSCDSDKEVYTWTITFTDGHTNAISDAVDGTLASNVSERKADGTYVAHASPSYSAGTFTQS